MGNFHYEQTRKLLTWVLTGGHLLKESTFGLQWWCFDEFSANVSSFLCSFPACDESLHHLQAVPGPLGLWLTLVPSGPITSVEFRSECKCLSSFFASVSVCGSIPSDSSLRTAAIFSCSLDRVLALLKHEVKTCLAFEMSCVQQASMWSSFEHLCFHSSWARYRCIINLLSRLLTFPQDGWSQPMLFHSLKGFSRWSYSVSIVASLVFIFTLRSSRRWVSSNAFSSFITMIFTTIPFLQGTCKKQCVYTPRPRGWRKWAKLKSWPVELTVGLEIYFWMQIKQGEKVSSCFAKQLQRRKIAFTHRQTVSLFSDEEAQDFCSAKNNVHRT